MPPYAFAGGAHVDRVLVSTRSNRRRRRAFQRRCMAKLAATADEGGRVIRVSHQMTRVTLTR